jgi:hypothetical protein
MLGVELLMLPVEAREVPDRIEERISHVVTRHLDPRAAGWHGRVSGTLGPCPGSV